MKGQGYRAARSALLAAVLISCAAGSGRAAATGVRFDGPSEGNGILGLLKESRLGAAPRLGAEAEQAGFAVYRDTTTGLAWSFSSNRMDWRSAGFFCDARGGELPGLEVLRALRVAGLVPQPGPGGYRWDAWSTEEYSYPHPGWSAAYIDITSGEWGVSRKTFEHGAACLHRP
ncbi:MAG: hypothetical protein HY928_05305 [Elusimicrobia bacterium]|nr:hypothetical protein [Elusimicrobiota bacterium]